MRRTLVVLLAAVLGLLTLATPARATDAAPETVDLVVGFPGGGFTVSEVPAAGVGQVIARLEADPGVAFAEVDVPLRMAAVPNDPHYPQQWGPPLVRAPEAWDVTTGSSEVVVAVLDTGVDPTHPDLKGRVLPGHDVIDDGQSGDPHGHGTGVAGVVAATGGNGVGVAGHCWKCRILPVRVLDDKGAGSSSGVAAGVLWATDNGADIINLSLAGPRSAQVLESALDYARAKGVMLVAAAGNQTADGQDLTVAQYPAALPGVLGITATTSADQPYAWSYRGSWTDLGAPGCVVTTEPNSAYGVACGTSFASPAVAGVLGLALSAFPDAPVGVIEEALLATGAALPGTVAASGRLDAAAFLEHLRVLTTPPPVEPIVTERIAGVDRVTTGVALSARVRDTAGTVIVARADSYADALAAAPLAGSLDAPVLLTPSTGLASAVAAEVRRLGATSAWLVGGTGALGQPVEDGLRAAGVSEIRRIAGTDRYDTAARIAQQVGGTEVFLTQAAGWPDAVAVSGLAAATTTPILLTDRDVVPAPTLAALASLGATGVTIVGGAGVVDDTVVAALRSTGVTVTRLAGASRYETSLAVADAAVAAGVDGARTWLATGAQWPDALAAGPAAAASGGVLLLVDGQSLTRSPTVSGWLDDQAGSLTELVVVGGEASVTAETLDALAALLD